MLANMRARLRSRNLLCFWDYCTESHGSACRDSRKAIPHHSEIAASEGTNKKKTTQVFLNASMFPDPVREAVASQFYRTANFAFQAGKFHVSKVNV